MKRIVSGVMAALFACSMAVGLSACAPKTDRTGKTFSDPAVTYKIDGAPSEAEGDQISDLLFGVFLEDINYASYAMDDNLVSNGSFEFNPGSYLWTGKNATIQVENTAEKRVHANNASYAKVTLTSGGATLTNSGYMAVPYAVAKDVDYNFSCFLRASDYEGKVKVRVASSAKTYAEASFNVAKSDEWIQYRAKLTAQDTASSGLSFIMEFESSGAVYLDTVKLETTDATIGIKNYIYSAIKDLSPKFVRFPGGCVIEGRSMTDAYDWKNSIGVDKNDRVEPFTYKVIENGETSSVTTYGSAATRIPNTDIWQNGSNYYQMDYDIGFYEYFLLCESIEASAIPIVNCGLSCMIQTGRPGNYNTLDGRYGNGIEDYINEAIDLVAFAKGDVNSTDANEAYWASVRKNMGHEKPFEMRYLGVGNEQWGAYYPFYEKFLKAFQDKAQTNPLYNTVELIVGNGVSFRDVEKKGAGGTAKSAAISYVKDKPLSEYGVHDHHYYMNYTDFFTNTDLYDSYSREANTRYDVFVGEYSANAANSLNNVPFLFKENSWITALSEAAYMTGLERNGDIVKLAAYAPMFGSNTSSQNQWAVDMMFYTNTELVLTPNYFVQQLFMQNQGTSILKTQAEYAKSFEQYYTLTSTNRIGSAEIDCLYQVVSYDAATGDIIIKIVNASENNIDVNFEISSASLTGVAHVTCLQNNDEMSVNKLSSYAVEPVKYTLGVGKKFGYTAEKYSVTSLRVHTK